MGGILFEAGMLSTLFEYSFRRGQEAAMLSQFRRTIREQVPGLRDAMMEVSAIHPEDLKRVATPELSDDLAANTVSLRLADEQFAHGISSATSTTRPYGPPSAGMTSGPHPAL